MADNNDHSLSALEQEKRFFQLLRQVDADTRLALEKMILWMAERPKDSVQLGMEQFEQMIEEVRLENIRRRLGGKVGEIRPFIRPEPKQ